MLAGGARWAVARGYGRPEDLERVEEGGQMAGADPRAVSDHAKRRQRDEMGTLGSGNHYLEVQHVVEIFDRGAANDFGLDVGDIVVSIHCGSRGLGHQIGTEFLREMVVTAKAAGIDLPDRELACAPIRSAIGERYLGAMRAAINCALANRQILTHLARNAVHGVLPRARLRAAVRRLAQHLQGRGARRRRQAPQAVRPPQGRDARVPARAPGAAARAARRRPAGADRRQHGHRVVRARRHRRRHAPVVRLGLPRRGAQHEPQRGDAPLAGPRVVDDLAGRGILIRSPSLRGVAEEAPGAYKDVTAVVDAADHAGLARKVAKLEPVVCVKG